MDPKGDCRYCGIDLQMARKSHEQNCPEKPGPYPPKGVTHE